MRALALTAILALAATTVQADPHAADYHELILNLPDGAQMSQAFRKTTSVDKNGVVQSSTVTSTYLNTVEPTMSGYDVVKKQTAFAITVGGAEAAPQSDQDRLSTVIAKAATIGEVSFAADGSLSPLEIKNWDQVKAKASAALSTALGPQSETVFNGIYGLFDAQTAAGAFMKEDVFLAIPHNTGLTLNQPITTNSEQAAPLGGGTLKFVTTLTLTRWDDAAHEAELDYNSAPEAASLHDYLQSAMPAVLKAGGVTDDGTIRAMVAQMTIEKSTSCHYLADTQTGLVKKADCTVKAGVSTMGQSQITTETYGLSEALVSE